MREGGSLVWVDRVFGAWSVTMGEEEVLGWRDCMLGAWPMMLGIQAVLALVWLIGGSGFIGFGVGRGYYLSTESEALYILFYRHSDSRNILHLHGQ